MRKLENTDIFLHIGHHKTGTTFLQEGVFPLLPINRVILPDVSALFLKKNYDPESYRKYLAEHGVFDGHCATLISSEMFSGKSEGSVGWNPYKVAERLKQTFPSAKILMCIRNQLEYILSIYTYRIVIEGLEKKSLCTYLEEKFESRLRDKLLYHKLLEHYIQLFGKENVLVIPYELLVEDHRVFVRTLLDFLNILELPDYRSLRVNAGERNSGVLLGDRCLNFLATGPHNLCKKYVSENHRIRLLYGYYSFRKKHFNRWLKKMFPRSAPLCFDSVWKKRLQENFYESNRELERITKLDLKKYGYP